LVPNSPITIVGIVGATEEFIEEVGIHYERLGLSRTAGRVIGALLVQPGGSADAGTLTRVLAVAKSSLSVALSQLERSGLVERYRVPQARRDSYRLVDNAFVGAFRAKLDELSAFSQLASRGIQSLTDSPEAIERLTHMRNTYEFMTREFAKLLDRWERDGK
jgi:DNA-binding transcriptional regulator GbsR (MarR family)